HAGDRRLDHDLIATQAYPQQVADPVEERVARSEDYAALLRPSPSEPMGQGEDVVRDREYLDGSRPHKLQVPLAAGQERGRAEGGLRPGRQSLRSFGPDPEDVHRKAHEVPSRRRSKAR